jgi:hypothetical protein
MDGLARGNHYLWVGGAEQIDSAELQRVNEAITGWYRDHDLSCHAGAVHVACQNTVSLVSNKL